MFNIYSRWGNPVYKVDQVPETFHESFIVQGYRNPQSSALQCLLSMFHANNETFNFWTHFLPFFYFLWILKGLSDQLDFYNDPYTWPMLVYMLMSCTYPLASAVAHLFNTMSDTARHVCFFIDYAALSLFSYGGAIVHRTYVFPVALRHIISVDLYLRLAVVNAFVSCVVSCQTRFMPQCLSKKLFRLSAFAGPYLYDCAPLIFRLLYGTEEERQLDSHFYHCRQFLFCVASVFLYASHIPERFLPGRFDIIGHSHQWFHVLSVLATLDHIRGILMDLHQRRELIISTEDYPSAMMCLGLSAIIVTLNIAVVVFFSVKMYGHSTKITNSSSDSNLKTK